VKWVGLISILAAIFPLKWWLQHNSRVSPKLWFLFGFLPFVLPLHLFMAAISWPEWPGFVHGLEFTVLDGLAIALWLSGPRGDDPLPFKIPMALYFLAVLVPTLTAQTPLAALFYPWQLMRMFVAYVAVTRAVFADPRVMPALLKGAATGFFLEAGIAIWQRFGLGLLQPAGTLDAQNLLGLISHLIAFPFFALLLHGNVGMLPGAVMLAAVIVEILTTSRATIGLAASGFVALFLLSVVRHWTSRKMLISLVGAAAMIAITPMVLSSFGQRQFVNSLTESNMERDAFVQAATMMFFDHPFGIGSNHYLVVANNKGYYQEVNVPPNSRTSMVHNVYLLIACETGWMGLFAFLLLLLRPIQVALSCGWRNRGDIRGDLMIGIGVGLLIAYIHSFFEWIFVLYEAQYMFAIQIGLVAGLAQQLGYWPTRTAVRINKYTSPSVLAASKRDKRSRAAR
jgi:O-antigen ligase